ncbi:DUF2207 domain-containing protein [Sporosarcina sp. CAU 1771]
MIVTNRKKSISLLVMLCLLLIPTSAFAVVFTITDVQIEAELQPNGEVLVSEKHTYVFKSEFNGLIRQIIPKEGASIVDFTAFENGQLLKVEENEGEYKIYRGGENETVTVDMKYRIIDGMEKFEDGAQFYWPFYDSRNETDYGSMQIKIIPPDIAKDVLYLGSDTAYMKGYGNEDGIVTFEIGYVPSGENGDVRVIYEPELFPDISLQEGTIRDKLLAEEARLADEGEVFDANRKKMSVYLSILVGTFGIVLVGFIGRGFILASGKRREVKEKMYGKKFSVPEAKMSMPATIYYLNGGSKVSETISAALFDLVRNGYVKQLSEERFELVNRNVLHAHEEKLIELLFDYVGENGQFELADLEDYTKNKKNHRYYNDAIEHWQFEVFKEVFDKELKKKKGFLHYGIALASLLMVVVAIQSVKYGLLLLLGLSIVLGIIGIVFAIVYNPRTEEGHQIYEEWKWFQRAFPKLEPEEWRNLSTEDKFRGFTFAITFSGSSLVKRFNEFIEYERRTPNSHVGLFYYDPLMMHVSFTSASTNSNPPDTSSSSSSSDGGTGGGGGGSGAF